MSPSACDESLKGVRTPVEGRRFLYRVLDLLRRGARLWRIGTGALRDVDNGRAYSPTARDSYLIDGRQRHTALRILPHDRGRYVIDERARVPAAGSRHVPLPARIDNWYLIQML